MGLLLIAIYEHYISLDAPVGALKHLLVIEEAHRLLQNTQSLGTQEAADMKGKAVETFNNMLSEVRAYGQGLIVADQIPTKLSPDIIKNTNLKLIHRLYAKDDRQIMGDCIGLDEEQTNELIRLKQGEAVLFHGQLDTPLKIKIAADRGILAEGQHDSKRPERIPLALEVFLLQDDVVRKTLYRLIHTYLLFPECVEGIHADMEGAVRTVHPKASLSSDAARRLWAHAIERFYKETRLYERVPYLLERELLHAIKHHPDPLQFFSEWAKQQFPLEKSKHRMARFSQAFESFRFYRGLFVYRDERLLAAVHKQADAQTFKHAGFASLLLKQSETGSRLQYSLLSPLQKQQLTDAMMLYEFEDYSSLLEAYFDVKQVSF